MYNMEEKKILQYRIEHFNSIKIISHFKSETLAPIPTLMVMLTCLKKDV